MLRVVESSCPRIQVLLQKGSLLNSEFFSWKKERQLWQDLQKPFHLSRNTMKPLKRIQGDVQRICFYIAAPRAWNAFDFRNTLTGSIEWVLLCSTSHFDAFLCKGAANKKPGWLIYMGIMLPAATSILQYYGIGVEVFWWFKWRSNDTVSF